ncbi:SWIM zinc finger family protein [Streptomyces lancefieldiae]|uniref:SWIM zinc finger family protein n=1 Tax=Streptomyces lancefieldiae TaxID=3075520 RepID=A0ABU3AJ93_9ACTN|nr:SWIM zinc finger family protein [Streptomyces sp. DSM 40712]MDT0610257.1 SWIM zinc finger family protein [Streptomyces sp. DSM 40712]
MTQQGVRWTADQVLALAPDAVSRKAGSRLGTAGPWSEVGSDEGTVWGLCRGSGSKPYQTVVDVGDVSGPAYKCSCPSRKFPCKHALGLLLLWAGGDGPAPEAKAPDWAAQWITRRRERTEEKKGTADPSGSAAGPSDPEAARRRAERRAERITAGATELEQRLGDLLRGGLAGAEQSGYGLWEETAARMVDAQAPGLAARVRELGAIPSSGPGWPVRLLEECALLHLLDQGWLRREGLPDGLAATVRSRVGLSASADGPPVRDRWLVLAQYDTADARLTTRRTWLYGTETDRAALLLSFGAAGRAPELALPVGLVLEAEVSAYPGTGQQRVALGKQFAPPAPAEIRPKGVTASQAATRYGEALRDDPWLESVPVTLERAVPVPDGDSWQLADADGDTALPLTPAAGNRPGLWRLVALSGGAPVKVFGECGHRGFTPLTAWPTGPGPAVPLC